ncbi:MAG: neutral zinc metallopeptidase, partial [Aquihabitans sp.]
MRERWAKLSALSIVGVVFALTVSACGVTATYEKATRSAGNPETGTGQANQIAPTVAASTTLPPSNLSINGDTGAPVNNVAGNAIVDLQAYWGKTFPEVYGAPYKPISGGFYAIDRNSNARLLPCQPGDINVVLNNAYYCPNDDAVAWDQENLMPDLAEKFGDFVVAVVLAHEWGHAIQERSGFKAATVVMELQADCFAGAWVKHVQDDPNSNFTVSTEALDKALAGVLWLRDAPGGKATDPNAHGSGFDRVGAFQSGFEQGAGRCKGFTIDDPKPFLFPFSPSQGYEGKTYATAGDLPLEQINTEAFASLDAYWADAFPSISGGKAWTPMKPARPFNPDDPPSCNGNLITKFRLFLCVPDRYVGYDNVDTIPAAYGLGDFAVATLFATQYGLEV